MSDVFQPTLKQEDLTEDERKKGYLLGERQINGLPYRLFGTVGSDVLYYLDVEKIKAELTDLRYLRGEAFILRHFTSGTGVPSTNMNYNWLVANWHRGWQDKNFSLEMNSRDLGSIPEELVKEVIRIPEGRAIYQNGQRKDEDS